MPAFRSSSPSSGSDARLAAAAAARGPVGTAAEPVIRVRGLATRFGNATIHKDLDLDVRRGEVLGVVGGSGTGKSVLLRTIVGLVHPAAGRIEIFGQDVTR